MNNTFEDCNPHRDFEDYFQNNGTMVDTAGMGDLDIPASALDEWTWEFDS